MDKNLAPIVLFVYNRPWHTKQTVEALRKNELTKESELFIYSDTAKNMDAQKGVDEVREYIKSINGFKKVTIIEREKNWGLADSIINGVTEVVNEYGKVIVLEDDLVTSPYFLKFMNEALEFYKEEKKVWHISGWNYPIDTEELEDVFFWRLMNCWGWATWADRWKHYEKNVNKTIDEFNKNDIYKFNIDGVEDFWSQVVSNKEGKINTWAIFWYATIFKQNGLCLNPTQTFVENIGHDESGVHCITSNCFSSSLNYKDNIIFNKNISENKKAIQYLKKFYKSNKKPLLSKIVDKVKRLLK
ncbi:MAG: glycosyltransferase [Sulfurimonas sp.]